MSAQREAFDRAIAAWNAADLDTYLELYDEGIALHGYSEQPMTKAEVRGFYGGLFGALSDIELEIRDVVESGPLLGCSFTMHGTHTGELAGIPATGRRIQQPGVTILRFDGDTVVERHSIADFETVVAQITAD